MPKKTSAVSGFHKLPANERLAFVKEFAGLTDEETKVLADYGALGEASATKMIENVVGATHLPLGIATNFLINDRDYLVPMSVEEPSVVAAASNAAKIARASGGFRAEATEPVMIGQIQVVKASDAKAAVKKVLEHKQELLEAANECDPTMIERGGGAIGLQARVLETRRGEMLVFHLLVDCRDAMGANAVNTMCEAIAPKVAKLAGGEPRLRIISNLSTQRLARVTAVFSKEAIGLKGFGGDEAIERILDAFEFACADPFRACTHNKGAMNGIDAVCVACGQDWRAVEAGAHAFASLSGKYSPITKYEKNADGDLVAEIELPLAVATVGGATRANPVARVALKILGVKTARELAEVIAAVGLAQNFAALRALATEGIQAGHMKLHARNIAVTAGAKDSEADAVAEQMVSEGKISVGRAQEILKDLRE